MTKLLRRLSVPLALFAVLAILVGCASSAPAPAEQKPAAAQPAAQKEAPAAKEAPKEAPKEAAKEPAKAATQTPIKIGFESPETGPLGTLGRDSFYGFDMYLEEIGRQVNGRPIVTVKEDDEAKPDVGLRKVKSLLEKDKIDILSGVIHSGVALAIRDYLDQNQIVTVVANATARDITGDKKSKYIYRASFASGQQDGVMAEYAIKEKGWKKFTVVAFDYAAGREQAETFIKGVKANGGEILKEIYVPQGTNDFSSYLASIPRDSQAVWTALWGTEALKYVTQYGEQGLKARIPLIGVNSLTDESYLKDLGDNAKGIITTSIHSIDEDTPVNKAFVKNYEAKYKMVPNGYSAFGYLSAQVIVEALKATKGDTSNKEELLKAMANVKVQGPTGPFRFDENRNAVVAVKIRVAEAGPDGKIFNRTFKTYNDIVYKP